MIDLRQIRTIIETTPEGGRAAVVRRKWLEELERELLAGRAAMAELGRTHGGSRVGT